MLRLLLLLVSGVRTAVEAISPERVTSMRPSTRSQRSRAVAPTLALSADGRSALARVRREKKAAPGQSILNVESPERLARLLFLDHIIAVEERAVPGEGKLKTISGFDSKAYERQRFINIVAIVVIALREAGVEDHRFDDVATVLYAMILSQIHHRWSDFEQGVDDAIAQAVEDCD
jgi:hypothetical protein